MLAAAALVAGCGGDEEEPAKRDPALPALTVPRGDTTEPQSPAEPPLEAEPVPDPQTETLPPVETEPAPGGGTPAPAPEVEPAPDTPENDVPPPAGSPAERFEQFCEDNPGHCG